MRCTAVDRCVEVDMPYWLFSHTNTTGSFQRAAMFRLSWKAPSLFAPSPKKQATTLGRRSCCRAKAAPTAIGRPPPPTPVGAQVAGGHIGNVHRAATAPAVPAVLAKELGEHVFGLGALGNAMAVAAVC